MKIRRFIRKRRRKAAKRLADGASAKHQTAAQRQMLHDVVTAVRLARS